MYILTAFGQEQPGPNRGKVDYCNLVRHGGNCPTPNEVPIKYYYSTFTGICEEFRYNGCGGNNNRFDTLRLCTCTCVPGEPPCQRMCTVISNCQLLFVKGTHTIYFSSFFLHHKSKAYDT